MQSILYVNGSTRSDLTLRWDGITGTGPRSVIKIFNSSTCCDVDRAIILYAITLIDNRGYGT